MENIDSKEYIKRIKVAELNRILPTLRVNISRHKEEIQFKNEISDIKYKIDYNESKIGNIKGLLPLGEDEAELSEMLERKREDLERENEKLKEKLDELNLKTWAYDEMNNFDSECYIAIVSFIKNFNGDIKIEEIKAEYLNEYLFLLKLLFMKTFSFSYESFLDDTAVEKLNDLSYEKYNITLEKLKDITMRELITEILK